MKNMLKLCMIGLMVLAGIAVLSCTDGTFEGTGGGGNLNIVNIPTEHYGKYCEVSVTGSGVSLLSFDPSSPRIQIISETVKAPLYDATSEKYTGNNTNLSVTVNLYDSVTGGTPNPTKSYNNVNFYSGSALVNW